MRIAVVHSYYHADNPSGENNVVDDQIAALADAGHEVRLFSRRTEEVEAAESGYALRSALRVATGRGSNPLSEVRAFAPHVVHVHNVFPNFGSTWLAKVDATVVTTVHNYRFECAAATLYRDGHACSECLRLPVIPAVAHGCYRSRAASLPVAVAAAPRLGANVRLLRRADGVACLNELARAHLARRVGDADKVSVLPNFPSAGPPVGAPPEAVVRADGLYVGRLTADKGIAAAAAAWPRGRRLLIIGDGPELQPLRRLASTRPEIEVLGRLPRDRVLSHMAAARMLLVPSMWPEGFPTVVLEALQVGLPVLLSEHVAVAADVRSAGAGEIFSLTDQANGLATAVDRLCARLPDAARSARSLFEREYSRGAWQERIVHFYASAAARSCRRKRELA